MYCALGHNTELGKNSFSLSQYKLMFVLCTNMISNHVCTQYKCKFVLCPTVLHKDVEKEKQKNKKHNNSEKSNAHAAYFSTNIKCNKLLQRNNLPKKQQKKSKKNILYLFNYINLKKQKRVSFMCSYSFVVLFCSKTKKQEKQIRHTSATTSWKNLLQSLSFKKLWPFFVATIVKSKKFDF